jgi:hypothetical protein
VVTVESWALAVLGRAEEGAGAVDRDGVEEVPVTCPAAFCAVAVAGPVPVELGAGEGVLAGAVGLGVEGVGAVVAASATTGTPVISAAAAAALHLTIRMCCLLLRGWTCASNTQLLINLHVSDK